MKTMILTTTDASHEVLTRMISDSSNTALRSGEREAQKYRAMGHICECIGVIEMEISLTVDLQDRGFMRTAEGLSMPVPHHVVLDRRVYCPVISPPVPRIEF